MKKKFWYFLCKNFLKYLSDRRFAILVRRLQCYRLGLSFYKFNHKEPKTFNEKINLLKFSEYSHDKNTLAADKVSARDYVSHKLGFDILIPVVGVYNSSQEIDFDLLPEKFILKANHGSGWNILCHDKKKFDIAFARKKLDFWLSCNAYFLTRESQYKKIKPRIICEELISESPNDYKIFCFNGHARVIQVDVDRSTNHSRGFYDLNWNRLDIQWGCQNFRFDIERPENLMEMISISERLSSDFEFARIDLYNVLGRIYFGEITLCPGGGFEPFASRDHDLFMGSFFNNSIV